MALAPDYVTIDTVKNYLRIGDTVDDTVLATAITAASRAIDHATNRQFGVETTPVARVYDPSGPAPGVFNRCRFVEIDDLMTTSGLVVKVDQDDDGTYEETVTGFDLWPWNAAADQRPWTHLVFRSDVSVPSRPRSVEITAAWGWTAPPEAVVQATLFQVSRWFKRREAPFGVAGSPEMGSELRLLARLDPDVAVIVAQLDRPWVAA